MSAVDVFVQSGGVSVITDGCGYVADNPLLATSKIMVAPNLPAVVALRGSLVASPAMASIMLAAANSFDELKKCAEDSLRIGVAACDGLLKSCSYGPDADFVFAGISKSKGPGAFIITNHTRYSDVPAFTPVDVGPVTFLPADENLNRKFLMAHKEPVGPDDFDPEKDGIRILELQRAKGDVPIGSFAQLTQIDLNGVITTRVVKRWPADIKRQKANQKALDAAWDEAFAVFGAE